MHNNLGARYDTLPTPPPVQPAETVHEHALGVAS